MKLYQKDKLVNLRKGDSKIIKFKKIKSKKGKKWNLLSDDLYIIFIKNYYY